MTDSTPWLTIIGIGEDGVKGLGAQAIETIKNAKTIMGASRHLELLGKTDAAQITWPIPFADGLEILRRLGPQPVVVLASGDPFWFGAATSITDIFPRDEWHVIPGRASMSLAAAHMGWPLEKTKSIALHAAPFETLRPYLQPHEHAPRLLVTLRDADAVAGLCAYLTKEGFGQSHITVLSALGGPRQALLRCRAAQYEHTPNIIHPLLAALEIEGDIHRALPVSSGLNDDFFNHDGQITKAPVRAMTLAALAPKPGQRLLDIGGGSGSVAIEWLLSHPHNHATCIEQNPDRAARITQNATNLGQHRLNTLTGDALHVVDTLPRPDAIFIGGGLSNALLTKITDGFSGSRLVVNAVTIENAALLTTWFQSWGGTLERLELSKAMPVGRFHSWKASYPITQWKVHL